MNLLISEIIGQFYYRIVKWLERLLAVGVLIGICTYAVQSGIVFYGMDWRLTQTFYELIYRVLLLVIGLELVRMLVVHDLTAILELLAFVIARKMLIPDIVALDIVLAVSAFVALLAARYYFLKNPKLTTKKDGEPDAQTYFGKRD